MTVKVSALATILRDYLLFQMDVIHGLTLSELHPDAVTTAYGPLADFITIAKGAAPR